MTDTTTTEGIADELGIQYGDFVTIIRGSRVSFGRVIGISDEGDAVQLMGDEGRMHLLEGADVSID